MKKIIYLIFGVIAMTLTACQTIEESIDYGLTAVMESTSGTKTSVAAAEAGGYNVLWSETDKIAVYADDATTPATFTLTGGAGTKRATFTGDVYGNRYVAFYPQTMLTSRSGDVLTINIPAEQKYVPGTFANDAYPMAAVTKSKELQFRNLCSIAHIALSGIVKVDKIIFRSNDDSKKVSGAATVDLSNPDTPVLTMDPAADSAVTLNVGGVQLSETEFTDFYIVLPPQTYSDGFTVEIYTGDKYYEKFYKQDFTMARSKMHTAKLSGYTGPIQANRWLTITSDGVTAISLENVSENAPVLFYSTDTQHWREWDYSDIIVTSDAPVYICGDNPDGFSSSTDKFSYFVASGVEQLPVGNISVSGDIMSLIDKDEEVTVIPNDNCFQTLFYNCEALTSGPSLPATTLTKGCYQGMFFGCSGLETAPELPATTVAENCYSAMFFACSSLTEAPVLPATTLAPGCYRSMFDKCAALTTAQESLPADVMEESCYENMFYGCTSLVAAPVLPATTLADRCYASMFYGCETLAVAPELPATNLAKECYSKMFSGCKNLTTAPEKLPATTLTESCYQNMFTDCVSLEAAPELPAQTLAEYSYAAMFSDCNSLTYVKCLAKDISAAGSTVAWLYGTASGGTFIKDKDMHDWKGGISGMPYEWFVENSDESVFAVNYLTFYAGQTQSAYDCSLTLDNYGGNAPVVYYSDDATNWKLWNYSEAHFSDTDTLYICGDNPGGFSKSCSEFSNNNSGVFSSFNKTGEGIYEPLYVMGDVMSLISKDEEITTIPCDYCFCRLFKGTPSLRNAPTLSATTLTKKCYFQMFIDADGLTSPPEGLPATSLKDSCYFEMFSGCSNISYAPELLATTLAEGCYQRMFYGCENLEEAPELPVMTLAKNCYNGMFQGCDIITDTPELPATELAEGCYFQMFQGCDELVNVSDLPATTLAKNCYWLMFRDCKKLATAPDLPATTLAQGCYSSMFMGCTSLTSAPEILPATTLVKSCYYQMFQGCTELTKAPELPAAVLMDACYYGMFKGCSKLNTIKCLATNIDASYCTNMWVDGVSSSGCFIKDPDMTVWSTGNSGIPTDWIVMNDGDTPGGGSEGTSEEEWN